MNEMVRRWSDGEVGRWGDGEMGNYLFTRYISIREGVSQRSGDELMMKIAQSKTFTLES